MRAKLSTRSRVITCRVASERKFVPSPLLGIHLLTERGTSHPHSHTLRSARATSRSARQGRVGMLEFAEPRIRRLVAEYLGVSAEVLTPEVSLTDDLAADSLDLVECAPM